MCAPRPGRSNPKRMWFSMNDKRLMFRLFLPLYATQFLGIGFLFTALAAISRDAGKDLDEIGGIFLLGMVWTLKFLWAPLVDRFGSKKRGHYRSWLMITQPTIALGIVAIAPFDVVENLGIILIILAVVAIASATQDIAADALAVRSVEGKKRGNINGLQIGAGFLGEIIGGGLVLVLYDIWGWAPAVLVLAALTALPIYFIRRYREEAREQVDVPQRVTRQSAFALFRQPGVKRWALIITPLLSLGMPGVYGMLVPMIIDAGISPGGVGLLTNGLGGAIGITSALGAGLLINKIGRRKALLWFGFGQLVAIASVLPVAAGGGIGVILLAIVLVNIGNSALFVAMYTINMDFSRKDNAGSDFTLQVSLSFGTRYLLAGMIFGVADASGYTPAVYICLGIATVGAIVAALLYRDSPTLIQTVAEGGIDEHAVATKEAPIATPVTR